MDNAPEAAPQAETFVDPSAGFWIRAGAYMIDGMVVGVAGMLGFFVPGFAGFFVRLALSLGYFTYLPVANEGQTFGKMAAGIAVIRVDEQPLTYANAFVRALGYYASTFTLGLGFLCAAFTAQKRGLHDYIAGTRVVRVQEIGFGRKFLVIACGALLPFVAVVGILAAIAIPKFSQLSKKAGEGAAKGNLGAIRSGLAIYYGDTEGNYPANLDALVPKYLQTLPAPKQADHAGATGVELYGAEVCTVPPPAPGAPPQAGLVGGIDPQKLHDTGRWGYVADPRSPCAGMVFVDCTHKDERGSSWYSY